MSETPKQQSIGLPPWLRWIWSWIWENGLGWLLTKYGIPILATALVMVSAMMQHWALPYVAMGGVVAFAVGSWASMSLEQRRYFADARAHIKRGGKTLPLALPVRTAGGPRPKIVAQPYDGEWGILLITNKGGDATFTARGQIVAVGREGINHTAPYLMIWKNVETHQQEKGHKVLVGAGEQSKLIVSFADWSGSNRTIVIVGDNGKVDRYSSGYSATTQTVTIEIEITSEPSMSEPFKARYSTVAPSGDTLTTLVREVKQDG